MRVILKKSQFLINPWLVRGIGKTPCVFGCSTTIRKAVARNQTRPPKNTFQQSNCSLKTRNKTKITMKPSILSSARLSSSLATALAALIYAQSASAQDGTWLGASGNWNASSTWSGGIIAAGLGSTANFTGVNITAARTITLTASQTIENITFTDATTSSHNLTINSISLEEILNLQVPVEDPPISPIINVTQADRLLPISSEVAGTQGLTWMALT
jgi:hypothetical protein